MKSSVKRLATESGDVDESNERSRQRLLDAMNELIGEIGYSAITVADVVARARTSRRTFYEFFSAREACYLALLTQHRRQIANEIADAVDARAPWETQVRQAVEAWIRYAESHSALMLSWIRDFPSLGDEARRLHVESFEAFIGVVQTLCNTEHMRAAGIGPVSRQRAIMLLGGITELTAHTVERGDPISEITEEAVGGALALVGRPA